MLFRRLRGSRRRNRRIRGIEVDRRSGRRTGSDRDRRVRIGSVVGGRDRKVGSANDRRALRTRKSRRDVDRGRKVARGRSRAVGGRGRKVPVNLAVGARDRRVRRLSANGVARNRAPKVRAGPPEDLPPLRIIMRPEAAGKNLADAPGPALDPRNATGRGNKRFFNSQRFFWHFRCISLLCLLMH